MLNTKEYSLKNVTYKTVNGVEVHIMGKTWLL